MFKEFVKNYLNDTAPLVMLTVLGVMLGVFGAANWHCGLAPDRTKIVRNGWSADQIVTVLSDDQYEQELEWRKANAVIPLVYAVPLAFGGFALAFMCGIAVLYKLIP